MISASPATPPAPPATVLVCTRGRGELVRACLAAIQASLRAGDQLLVVEAGGESARGVVAGLADPRCRWMAAPRTGKCRQLNDGILAAGGEVVVITDDDCLVAPGWVDAMARPFLERGVGVAFGPVTGLSSTPGAAGQPERRPGPATAEDWTHAHGASMAVSRTAVLQAGGFDERFGPGTAIRAGEEADLLLRIEASGWRAWSAEAPVVEHVEWRGPTQELDNALAYERGGGAWVGAALRRGPLLARRRIELRLRYQLGHFRSGGSRAFAVRASAAFLTGMAAGLRLTPRRFLPAPPHPQPPTAPGIHHALPGLPLPSVRGRRCLVLGDRDGVLDAELAERGAAEVVSGEPNPATRFDLVVECGQLNRDPAAPGLLRHLRELCGEDGQLLSIEPVSIPLVPGRGVLGAGAHRELLSGSGFEIRNVSRIFVVHEPGAPAARWPGRAVQRSLTGDAAPGRAHRAILAVPTR